MINVKYKGKCGNIKIRKGFRIKSIKWNIIFNYDRIIIIWNNE